MVVNHVFFKKLGGIFQHRSPQILEKIEPIGEAIRLWESKGWKFEGLWEGRLAWEELGGGFRDFLFPSLFGEDSHFD